MPAPIGYLDTHPAPIAINFLVYKLKEFTDLAMAAAGRLAASSWRI